MTLEAIRLRCIECGDCLLWQGATTGRGHPQFKYGEHAGKSLRRIVYTHHNPQNPIGARVVSVRCKEPTCLSPDHLYLRNKSAVSAQMARDPATKLRRSISMGRHAQAVRGKITMEIARQIRASSDICKVEAEKWGIHFSLVSKVRRNHAWIDRANPFAGLL